MTLGNAAAAAGVRLIVWCRECGRHVQPNAADMAETHGVKRASITGARALLCSARGSSQVDLVISANQRREAIDQGGDNGDAVYACRDVDLRAISLEMTWSRCLPGVRSKRLIAPQG
jgi:hypothetical protein